MRAKRLAAALTVGWVWSSVSALADDKARLQRATRAIQEMLERLADVRSKPDGFVDPPDPTSTSIWCRIDGAVRVAETPLAGSLVRLLWISKGVTVPSRVDPVTTTNDGKFVIPRVPLGQYRMIGASEDGEWEYEPTIVLTSTDERKLDVSLGAKELAVTVLGQDLKPVAGANVEREFAESTRIALVNPMTTDAGGRATVHFLADGINRIRASVGDVTASIGVYAVNGVGQLRMILPPYGTVEVRVKGWKSDESVGSIQLTSTRAGKPTTLGQSNDESGLAVLRCSPGRWEFSIIALGGAFKTPASARSLEVQSGQVVVIEVPSK